MPFIAIGCVELLMLVTQRKSYSISQIVAPCLFTILFFGCEKIVRTHAFSQVGYTHNDNIERGFWYYALLGQNNESGGQWDKHIAYEVGNHPGTRQERDAFFRDEAIKAISSRGVFGNVKFYIAKTSIAWGCTKMDILKTSNDHLNSILYYIRHFIWYFIMTMMCFTAIVVNRKKECAMLLALLGVLLYLLISECSFTYVIMYSPVVFILGGIGMHNLSNRQTK